MGGKWLSGRKRQTVNLLGNSRWFESNLSQVKNTNAFNKYNKYIYIYGKGTNLASAKHRYLKKLKNNMVLSSNIFGQFDRSYFNLINKYYPSKAVYIKVYNNKFIDSVKAIVRNLSINQYNNRSIYFRINNRISNEYNLMLNFKRNRFFPYFYMNEDKNTIFNNSLGIISKRFSEKKSFLKGKSSYIMSSSYIRRLLLYIRVKRLRLNIIKTPKYLKDLLVTIMTNSNNLYRHPFKEEIVNEKESNPSIYFDYVSFVNNKALGPIKKKKERSFKKKSV